MDSVFNSVGCTAVKQKSILCVDESATQRLGVRLLSQLKIGTLLTLRGELGAGKSVLARAIIHAAGYTGRVKSPTYTLIENYEITDPVTQFVHIAHLDLYRLADPDELHYLGFDDVLTGNQLVIVEWPEKAGEMLPEPCVDVLLEYASDGGRKITINP